MEQQRIVDEPIHIHKRESFFSKMKGNGKNPLAVNSVDAFTALIGSFISIGALFWLTHLTGTEWLMAPFGASCVLVFGVWNVPFSQPRNVIGGHVIAAFVGLLFLTLFGGSPLMMSAATAVAICAMMLTKTTHPPAGANAIVVMSGGYEWVYLASPVFIGAIIIVLVGLVVNNMRENRSYPVFWW